MELAQRCIHCMAGSISGGVCTCCGKPAFTERDRPQGALPARYLLCKNQYYLGKVLGSGGFGVTYLAWDHKNQRRVALKELFPRYLSSREKNGSQILTAAQKHQQFLHLKKRFCQEAQALYELRAVPEVIDVYHLFEENGTAYYAMEYMEGEDLKKYLADHGKMKWEQMVNPLCMVLRALHALHNKKLIHRDISPDNIFLLQGGGAKLIDFGSVRSTDADRMTRILKERFAPYEQFEEHGNQGPWTDIYSLSITLYYALGGVLPPRATDRYIAWKMHGDSAGGAKPIRELCPDIPEHAAYALQKGMAAAAEQRYQSIQEFAAALFPGTNILAAVPADMRAQQKRMQNPAGDGVSQPGGRYIKCVSGMLAGRVQPLFPSTMVTVGRAAGSMVRYPDRSPGISRKQCSLMMDQKGIVYIRDDNSTYGTYVDGKRLKPAVWHSLHNGSRIGFAKEQYYVV